MVTTCVVTHASCPPGTASAGPPGPTRPLTSSPPPAPPWCPPPSIATSMLPARPRAHAAHSMMCTCSPERCTSSGVISTVAWFRKAALVAEMLCDRALGAGEQLEALAVVVSRTGDGHVRAGVRQQDRRARGPGAAHMRMMVQKR